MCIRDSIYTSFSERTPQSSASLVVRENLTFPSPLTTKLVLPFRRSLDKRSINSSTRWRFAFLLYLPSDKFHTKWNFSFHRPRSQKTHALRGGKKWPSKLKEVSKKKKVAGLLFEWLMIPKQYCGMWVCMSVCASYMWMCLNCKLFYFLFVWKEKLILYKIIEFSVFLT